MPPVSDGAERAARVARWLDLTRRILPAMADEHAWLIRQDHCFMRVCLDTALARPWREVVAVPAIRGLSDAQLEDAIAVAERVAAHPSTLPALNAASLDARRRSRRAGPPVRA